MTSKYIPHFGMGRALGYDMWVSINKAGLSSGSVYTSDMHAQLVTAAGPVVTLVMAAVVSLANPNDEAAISAWLGIGMWTLPLAMGGLLFGMVLVAGRRIELGWKSWLLSWLATSLGITLVVLTETYWPVFGA